MQNMCLLLVSLVIWQSAKGSEVTNSNATNKKPTTTKVKTTRNKLWSGNYTDVNCGSAKECVVTAYHLAKQGKLFKANEYRANACDKGFAGGCHLIGMYYIFGKKNLKDKYRRKEATKWYKRACTMTPKQGYCFTLVDILIYETKFKEALPYFNSFCTGVGYNCRIFATSKYSKFLNYGCKSGSTAACNLKALSN